MKLYIWRNCEKLSNIIDLNVKKNLIKHIYIFRSSEQKKNCY